MRLHNINTSNTVSATQPYVDTAVATKLSLAGGTMTGPIVLPANPTTPLQAATKQYSDSGDTALQTQVTSLQGTVTTLNASPVTLTYVNTHDALKVNKAGDTMTGQLVLPGAPTLVTHAVTKGYVDTLVTTHTANVALHLTPAQNTLLDAVTVTSTEINTLSGTTSNIQTQINTLSTTLVPTGTVIEVDTTTTPSKYLRTNGTQVSKTTYAALFAVIGERYATITMPSIIGQPWRQQYSFNKANSTISAWVANTPLPISISSSHVIVTNNRVYLLGGWLNNTTSTVYTAPINPNGTLGAWVTSTPLPIALWGAQAIVTNNRVYLLGGIINGVYSSAVYTAPINPDGTLGSWVIDTPLPGTITNSQAIITNNRVYLLGGATNNGAYSSSVYTASINIDGTLSTWTINAPLPVTISHSQAIVTNNRVYLLGGYINGVDSVYTTIINPDGTLGAWVTDTPLPNNIKMSQAIVTNNRVYLIGGNFYKSGASIVYTATINPDGTLGAWVIDTPLPVVISHSQAVVTSNRVYLLGGHINNTQSNAIYTAPINTDGTLGTWVADISIIPNAIYNSQAIVTNNRVYLIGGFNKTVYFSTVYTAPINPDGTLGGWVVDTPLPETIAISQAIVTNNRVYLLGGRINNILSSTIYTAPINADGTLGTWVTDISLPIALNWSQAIVTNNRVYLLGGITTDLYGLNTVYSAPFSGGLNNYLNPVSVNATTFTLPDYTIIDAVSSPKTYHYIKF